MNRKWTEKRLGFESEGIKRKEDIFPYTVESRFNGFQETNKFYLLQAEFCYGQHRNKKETV